MVHLGVRCSRQFAYCRPRYVTERVPSQLGVARGLAAKWVCIIELEVIGGVWIGRCGIWQLLRTHRAIWPSQYQRQCNTYFVRSYGYNCVGFQSIPIVLFYARRCPTAESAPLFTAGVYVHQSTLWPGNQSDLDACDGNCKCHIWPFFILILAVCVCVLLFNSHAFNNIIVTSFLLPHLFTVWQKVHWNPNCSISWIKRHK